MNQLCLPNAIVLIDAINGRFFKKGPAYFLHLNINSLPPKIDEIRFISKHLNAFIIGISDYELDSAISNSKVDIENYDLIRIDCSRRGGRIACCTRNSLNCMWH